MLAGLVFFALVTVPGYILLYTNYEVALVRYILENFSWFCGAEITVRYGGTLPVNSTGRTENRTCFRYGTDLGSGIDKNQDPG